MGALFTFVCPDCGYEAEVSGGLDFGMLCATHTVSCPTCKALSDMDVSGEPWTVMDWMQLEGEDEQPSIQRVAQAEWMPSRIRCGLDGRHKAELWSDPGPCPRCGAIMKRGQMEMLWD